MSICLMSDMSAAPALTRLVPAQIARWHDSDNTAEASCIARSPTGTLYAVGYADGCIRLWDLKTNTCDLVFNGHRGAITSLAFDKTGTLLASGAKDTHIIVWDLVGDVGRFR